MREYEVKLVPHDGLAELGKQEGVTSWQTAVGRASFDVFGGDAVKAPGLYRLSLNLPDGFESLSAPVLKLDTGEGFSSEEIAPLRLEGTALRPRAYFSVPEAIVGLRLEFSTSGGTLRIDGARLRRMSTSVWRAQRAVRVVRARIRSPSDMLRYGRVLAAIYKRAGLRGLIRALANVDDDIRSGGDSFRDMKFEQFLESNASYVKDRIDLDLRPAALPASGKPSLSIIVPVYNTPEVWLRQLIGSINSQTDLGFELLFVFDGPQESAEQIVRTQVRPDINVKLERFEENRGVSSATNEGIRRSSGDYVVVVDHDDILEHRLVEAFRLSAIVEPGDIYFADEAVTDRRTARVLTVSSRGKFDIRHYLSHPYIVHPIFIRRSIAVEAGLLDEGLRVSHDVDFFLRCVSRADTIVHIPLVLYYWRTHGSSLGHKAATEVSQNTRAAIGAFVEDHFEWRDARIMDGPHFNTFEVVPPLPGGAKAAIVIPTKNRADILAKCLQSIYERSSKNVTKADIYVIDHDSDDPGALDYLATESSEGRITVIRYSGTWNFSAINNYAVRQICRDGQYSHLVFMNNDIEVTTGDWLDGMLSRFAYSDVGVVGCCLVYPSSVIQHGGVVVGLCGAAEHSHKFSHFLNPVSGEREIGHLGSLVATRDYGAVTGALMAVPAKLFEEVGGFDEGLAVGFNDVDLCLRIGERGYQSCYVGTVVAVHHESISRGKSVIDPHPEDSSRFLTRHADLLRFGDEHYGNLMDWWTPLVRFSFAGSKKFKLRATRMGGRDKGLALAPAESVARNAAFS